MTPRLAACLTLCALALALAPAPGNALAANDAAATQAYVQADYRLTSTAAGRIPIGEAALRGVLSQVRGECPRAAAGSPQDAESTQLSNEVIGTMVTSAIRRDLPSIREFLGAAGRLRWSGRGLTSAVQGYVSRLRTLASLPTPHLCADVQSWAASGFRALPASTNSFDARFMPAWVALGEQFTPLSQFPGGPLTRFESGEVRALAARAHAREVELSDFEARAVETWGAIMNTLGLSP
jgi:hypothetical protein